MSTQFKDWWSDQTRKGDPSRNVNLVKEAFEAGMVADRWLPIETAPKDGTRIMLGQLPSPDYERGISTIGWWQEGYEDGVDYIGVCSGFVDYEFQYFNGGRDFGNLKSQYAPHQPTHWMPLPEAPKK